MQQSVKNFKIKLLRDINMTRPGKVRKQLNVKETNSFTFLILKVKRVSNPNTTKRTAT